jgi:tRNA-uridine 2-sulfurtransferase
MKNQESIFRKHFKNPQNIGELTDYNASGKDSNLRSEILILFNSRIEKNIIADIRFKAFGCSYSIAASSMMTLLAKGKDLFEAARITEDNIEEELGNFPENKKDVLKVTLGAFRSMLTDYISNHRDTALYSRNSKRAVVAMSGGVDSSMVAKILKEEGYNIIGMTMRIVPPGQLAEDKLITRSTSVDIESAYQVCRKLNIPYFIIDLSPAFKEKIIDHFCDSYLQGLTPNPCVECNKQIKFGLFLKKAEMLGADFMATGHYCRIEKEKNSNIFQVLKGADRSKDQSYVFWKLDQSQLSRIRTPLGNFTKENIKKMSKDFIPDLASKDESQDICFIPNQNYQDFLGKKATSIKEGKIINSCGIAVGRHKGYPFYTIGQRRGLGISHPSPLYVIKIKPEDNIIVVGEKKELLKKNAMLKDINFISGEPPSRQFHTGVKVRYSGSEKPAEIRLISKGEASVTFKSDCSSITPGQSAVFYTRENLVGGGIIKN